ncbi:response regulator transcription factor [Membranihabitans maritimus]|uniref:response regulator transcription factor n=1 Tax=Membranihabitans maritimus TaxID=2904244 RepID=UPI001F354DFC|nr:response regulator [Membranihabitans maritimus]
MKNQELVLIAEDERIIRRTLQLKLEKEGFNVLTAEDGQQAIEMLESSDPDIVVTDLMMPFRNGLEVLEFVKKKESEIPVIVLSAAGQENIVLDAFNMGASDYITKPFSPNEIVVRIKKLILKS